YPTLSPLPRPQGGAVRRGGLLSVALSLGSPPPAVSRHRVSMEPGLSSPAAFRLSRVRPPGQLAPRYKGMGRRNCNSRASARTPRQRLEQAVQGVERGTIGDAVHGGGAEMALKGLDDDAGLV